MIPKLLRGWQVLADVGAAADEDTAGAFRAKQLVAIARLTFISVVGNFVNVLIVWHALHPWVNEWSLRAWVGCSMAVLALGVRSWWRIRHRPPPVVASRRAVRAAIRNAIVLACMWGVVPAVFFSRAEAQPALLISLVSAGMLLGGGFALATVPAAALSYVAIMLAGSLAGLVRDGASPNLDIILLLMIYACIVGAAIGTTSATFSARLNAEAEAQHQKDLVSLLLRDFETNSSDWLWETDELGVLRHISPRMRQVIGIAPDAAPAIQCLPDMLRQMQDCTLTGESGIRKLESLMRVPAPFRDHAVAVDHGGAVHWWSLTATPMFARGGVHVGWRGVGTDITERRRSMEELDRLASSDSLTGLANRHALRKRLEAMVEGTGEPFALLYFDLDKFKHVNDSLGHLAGDELLRQIAQRLRAATFPGDMLARLGGDEFAVICAEVANGAAAAQRAAMLLDAVRAPCRIEGRELHVASSAGIALFPAHGGTVDELVRNSDMALYAAKAAGRDTWRFFDEAMGSEARQRLALQSDLARAVELGQLELHYQPQVDMGTRRVRGFEALVRWRHPQHGLVPPARFIPVAEECGLIVPIGNHVLRMACAEAARWPGNAGIAVNVSGIQFSRSDLVHEVREALRASGLAPQRLEIEVTESVLIDDRAGTKNTLQALRELGVGVALDDFGTGYSSLVYLRDYPLTKLKIDRSFVSTMRSDQSAVAIVRSIVLLAQEMSLDLVAEGIETQDEQEALLTLGCSTGQGWLFASPMPTTELALYIGHRLPATDAVAVVDAA